jgi:hypothetical protein
MANSILRCNSRPQIKNIAVGFISSKPGAKQMDFEGMAPASENIVAAVYEPLPGFRSPERCLEKSRGAAASACFENAGLKLAPRFQAEPLPGLAFNSTKLFQRLGMYAVQRPRLRSTEMPECRDPWQAVRFVRYWL